MSVQDVINSALDRAAQGRPFEMQSLGGETNEQRATRLNAPPAPEAPDGPTAVFADPLTERGEAARELEFTVNASQWLAEKIETPRDPNYTPPAVGTPAFEAYVEGIPEKYWPNLGRAHSELHARMLRDDILAEMDAERRLDADGWRGTTARIGAAISDPVNLAVTLVNPGGSVLMKGTKLARAAKLALAAGAENTALEAITLGARETKNPDDLYLAFVGGAVIGGGLGAVLPSPDAAKRLYEAGKDAAQYGPGNTTLSKAVHDAVDAEYVAALPDDSVGAARVRDMGVEPLMAAEDVPTVIANTPQLKGLEAKVRFDWYAQMAKSDIPFVRWAGNKLLADPVGHRGGVQDFAAEEYAGLIKKRAMVKFYQQANPALAEHLDGVPVGSRTLKTDEFFQEVTNAIRRGEYSDTPIGRTAKAMAESLEDVAKEAKRMGVKGFDLFETGGEYVPRIPNASKINQLSAKYGQAQIERILAESFARGAGVDSKYALKVARGYIKNVRLRGAGIENDFSLSLANKDALAEMMRKAGSSEDEIKEVIDGFETLGEKTPDAGAIGRAKSRIKLDESYAAKLKDKDYNEAVVSVTDLFENDARILTRQYVSSVGGHAALARAGFADRASWDKFLDDARKFADGIPGRSSRQTESEIAKLEQLHSLLTGKPLIDYNDPLNALSHNVRDWAYLAQSGSFGFAQASEFAAVATLGGVNLMARAIPELSAIFKRAADGHLTDALAREIEDYTGSGTDALLHSTLNRFAHEYDSELIPRAEGAFGAVEPVKHQALKAAGYASGLTPITVAMQRLGSRFIAQRIVNEAFGTGRGWSADRLLAMGLEPKMQARIFDQIKKHAVTEAGSNVKRLDLHAWTDVDARDSFVLAVQRETQRTVLTPNLGASIPAVHSSEMLKVLTQFSTFMVQAHSRLLLNGVKRMDAERAVAWLAGTGLASLAYVARTHLQSIGRRDKDKYLREKLTEEKIAAAAFNMSGYSALIPMVYDTSAALVPGVEPVFSDARTSGLGTSATDLGRFPAGAIVQGVGNTVSGMNDGRFTQKDWQQLQRIIPFARVLGVQQSLNILGSNLPEK